MSDQDTPATPAPEPAARRRPSAMALLVAGALGGLALGFTGVASAQTTPEPAPSTSVPSTSAPSESEGTTPEEPCDKDRAADSDASADTASV